MSFGWTAATWLAIGAVTTGVSTIYNGIQSNKAQSRSLAESKRQAAASQQASDQANNKANSKSPDVSGLLGAAGRASGGGQAGTLLTGPQGLASTQLTLGKSTLLGGGG